MLGWPNARIRESSAATTQSAAHQVAGPKHPETEPLQKGLTGNVTLSGTGAQLTEGKKQANKQTEETDSDTNDITALINE